MKKIAVFDIDGTLFRWQLYHELVFELKALGRFTKQESEALDVALISWQAKHISWRDYEHLVIHTIDKHLTTIKPSELEQAAQSVVERSGHKIYSYTAKLLKRLQDEGYYTLALSSSQREIAAQFAAKYDFSDCIGQTYERTGDTYTGAKQVIVHGRKDVLINEYLSKHTDLTLEDSIAVGDSGGDISMLELVTHPIAFNPSEELLESALENSWKIVIERKNIAYTLEAQDGHVVLAKTDRF